MRSSAGKIQLASLDELFGTAQAPSEPFQEIPLADLHPFKGHPFHIMDDEKMQELTESVAQHGILVPGIVRPRPEGGYELVSGHRRKRACELARLDTMSVFVRELDDTLEQSQRLKKYSQDGQLTDAVMDAVLSDKKPVAVQITLKKERLKQYFPQSYTQQQMEDVIFSLLETWKLQQEGVAAIDQNE